MIKGESMKLYFDKREQITFYTMDSLLWFLEFQHIKQVIEYQTKEESLKELDKYVIENSMYYENKRGNTYSFSYMPFGEFHSRIIKFTKRQIMEILIYTRNRQTYLNMIYHYIRDNNIKIPTILLED